MRDLRRWILIGLGVAVVSLAAIGYGLIATDIATPPGGNLGTVAAPDEPGAVPVFLADGRPAFVVRTADAIHVVDARPPVEAGTPNALVTWCDDMFLNWVSPGTWLPDGGLMGGAPSGLIVYPVAVSTDGSEAVVGRDGSSSPEIRDPAGPYECDGDQAVMHEPAAGEAFDPSVAAEEEPPGWIWLEGRLEAIGGQALLCDGAGADCATGAVVRGIDPAKVAALAEPMAGLFLGRVADGGIEELHYVPHSVRGR
jgi:hypothetical protein